jgi:hypothetical protein
MSCDLNVVDDNYSMQRQAFEILISLCFRLTEKQILLKIIACGALKAVDKIMSDFIFKYNNQTLQNLRNELVYCCFHFAGNLTGSNPEFVQELLSQTSILKAMGIAASQFPQFYLGAVTWLASSFVKSDILTREDKVLIFN